MLCGDAYRGRRAPVIVWLRLHEGHATTHLHIEAIFNIHRQLRTIVQCCHRVQSDVCSPAEHGNKGTVNESLGLPQDHTPSRSTIGSTMRAQRPGRGSETRRCVSRLPNAMRPLHRLGQVNAAQHAFPRLLLEIFQHRPEGPAGRAVLRQLGAPRAGAEQAHPVLPAPVAVVVVVTVVTPVRRRRVVVFGTTGRHKYPARWRHLERRQPGGQRPTARAAEEPSAAAVGIVIVTGGSGVWCGAVEEDERRRVLGRQPRQRPAGTLQPRAL